MESALEMLERAERVLRRHLGRLPADVRQAVEQEVIGLLRMARAALPGELRRAAALQAEAEAALAQAREEARRLVLDAQARARAAAEGGPSPEAAASLDEIRREAERIRRGADEYAADVLQRLEAEVERVLATIRRGQEVLRAPRR